jgi:hypothetical protein
VTGSHASEVPTAKCYNLCSALDSDKPYCKYRAWTEMSDLDSGKLSEALQKAMQQEEEAISQITDMGFSRDQAKEALRVGQRAKMYDG